MKIKKMFMGVLCASFLSGISIPIINGTKEIFSIQNNENLNKKAEQVIEKFELNNKILSNSNVIKADKINNSPILVDSDGPIVSYGSIIYGLDWFAGKRWEINLMDNKYSQYFPGNLNNDFGNHYDYPPRAFRNWTLDVQNHNLWILSNSQKIVDANSSRKCYPQTVIKINSLTGKITSHYQMEIDPYQKNGDGFVNPNRLYEQISVLKNGNILVYSFSQWWKTQLLDIETGKFTINDSSTNKSKIINFITSDVKKYESNASTNDVEGTIRLYNLVPLSNNANIAILGSILYGDGDDAKASGNLYLALVDDNLNPIEITDLSSPWYYDQNGNSGMVIVKNSKIASGKSDKSSKYDSYVSSFSRSYYYTVDGNVVSSMFSEFFLFQKPTESEVKSYGVRFAKYTFQNNAEISSFTMDVNGNIFYKLKNDTKIYKMIIAKADDFENTSFMVTTYYDISSNNNQFVKDNAENFILYNVKGYSGSIMLISTNPNVDPNLSKVSSNFVTGSNDSNIWGLALAIVPNKNDQSNGDSLGLLNSDQSILKTADFEIDQNVLDSKLPSEITREDIVVKNDAFFTRNSQKDVSGELKYPPFKLENINDREGTFDVVVNLDQIPWFATTLPSDATPKTIIKVYDGKSEVGHVNSKAQLITSKISWKNDNELTYDFRNMLPTKISLEDVKDFDPFKVSFSSRTVLNSDGSVKYPKKTYSIENPDDTTGHIDIKITYDYMPVSSEVNQPLSYTESKQYTIFKNDDTKSFYFAGANSQASSSSSTSINVKDVPQLKYLSESNMLPSSFNGANKSSLLPFVDTEKSKGYPLSKMNFTVSPNDETGELTITATMPSDYYGTQQVFKQTYTGLNRKSKYEFNFIDNVNTVGGKSFSTLLPSSINEGDVVADLITYSGFDSSDFTISLFPKNEDGSLTVKIKLDESYPESLANSKGFKNYIIEKDYKGFMTTNDFNSQYNIEFYDDSSEQLVDIKKKTLSEINEGLKENKTLTIANKTYSNLNQLIDELFIKNRGVRIPNNWGTTNNNYIISSMTFDNQAGTMNLSITIKKEALNGYDSDLNFVASYSGFTKGNKDVTQDNLSFVSNELLKVVVPEVSKMNAKEMAEWLNENDNLKKILFSCTGQYESMIQNKQYNLKTQINEAYNSLTITIEFTGNLTDNKSLTTYSMQYIL